MWHCKVKSWPNAISKTVRQIRFHWKWFNYDICVGSIPIYERCKYWRKKKVNAEIIQIEMVEIYNRVNNGQIFSQKLISLPVFKFDFSLSQNILFKSASASWKFDTLLLNGFPVGKLAKFIVNDTSKARADNFNSHWYYIITQIIFFCWLSGQWSSNWNITKNAIT